MNTNYRALHVLKANFLWMDSQLLIDNWNWNRKVDDNIQEKKNE